MKKYERDAAYAILNRDRRKAAEALALHPLVESYSVAETLIEQYIELNKDYISGWN